MPGGGGGAAGSNVGGVSSLLGRNRGDASEPGDVAESPGKSSLFFVKDRVRGIGSSGDTEKVPVERRGSGGVRCAFGGPGKSGSGFRSSRVGPYPPSAAGLQGVQPLVDGINVGKGSRQNGSVPSEEGLAPRTGSVGPCPREARNRYGAVAFAPFALCGAGSRCRSGPSALRRRARVRVGSQGSGSAVFGGTRTAAFFGSGGRACVFVQLAAVALRGVVVVCACDASFTNSESTRFSRPDARRPSAPLSLSGPYRRARRVRYGSPLAAPPRRYRRVGRRAKRLLARVFVERHGFQPLFG